MRTSQKGVDLIKSFEGLSLKAVKLLGEQYWTIGYGHYGPDVAPGQTMTPAKAEDLLRQDLAKFESWVSQHAPWPVNQNEFDALVSFCYNCGPGSLQQLVRGRSKAQVAAHMLTYTHSGSEAYTQGLINRRKKERALFLAPAAEEDIMTGKEIYEALSSYLEDQTPPASMQTELAAAQAAGIWDGGTPTSMAPRYQAAAMAWRAYKLGKTEQTPEAPVLALAHRIHELESQVEALEREKRELMDEINVLHSDVKSAREGE